MEGGQRDTVIINPAVVFQPLANGSGHAKYCLRGLVYFISHPKLWGYVICPLILALILSVVAMVLLFALALHPQAKALINLGTAEWLGWLLGVLLVLLETAFVGYIIVNLVFGWAQDKVFEKTLELEGVALPEGFDTSRACGVEVMHVMFRAVVFLITLPLNLVPVLGQLLFAALNGWLHAWDFFQGFFEAKEMTFGVQLSHMCTFHRQYFWFGFGCQLLELVPYVGLVAMFSNFAAAALFVIDQERGQGLAGKGARVSHEEPDL